MHTETTIIDLNEALFKALDDDYIYAKENQQYQSQFQAGFDYIEALVKFFGTISISVVKDIDEDTYKDIFTKNFKLSPSLGDFKSLTTHSVSPKRSKNLKDKNDIYDYLNDLFNREKYIKLDDIASLLDGESKKVTKKSTRDLLDTYVVTLRNKLKGHGASFSKDDTEFRDQILQNIDTIIVSLKEDYDDIINNITFNLKIIEEKITPQIIMEYKNENNSTSCDLLAIISYFECNKFSCDEYHKNKIFFYNDGKESKSHYLDYSKNHYWQITQKNDIHNNLKELQSQVLHASSDEYRYTELLSNFVGREADLTKAKKHILKSIEEKKSSFFTVMGSPGIGKSAFLTQLQNIISEDDNTKEEINTYTFYAQKGQMGPENDEAQELLSKLSKYFDKFISPKYDTEDTITTKLETIFDLYEKDENTKPLILIIDGLDEFFNPTDIIKTIPIKFNGKIHLIYSSRPYDNIKQAISSKFADATDRLNILNSSNIIKDGYSFELGSLKDNEVESLLSSVIPKDINRDSDEYWTIVDTIAKQSEGLPLYIHYIVQQLKETNITDDIQNKLIEYAKKLPPKLDSFYNNSFIKISPVSRDILYMLYLSRSTISKRDLFVLLNNISDDTKQISQDVFYQDHFNGIEIFLKQDKDENYGFYHLSVKEAIEQYLLDKKVIFKLNESKLKEHISNTLIDNNIESINSILYMDEDSYIYKLLQKSVDYLKENKKLEKYYDKNFLHMYNTLVWFDIYTSLISYDEIVDEDYTSLATKDTLDQDIIDKVNDFCEKFELKQNKYKYEIRYAYELSMIIEDYDKTLKYADIYIDNINQLFLDITLNLDKPGYIQKFIDHKDDWNNALNDNTREVFVNIMIRHKDLDNSFEKVIEIIEDKITEEDKIKLYLCLNNPKKALEIVLEITRDILYNINNDEEKTELLNNIAVILEKYNDSNDNNEYEVESLIASNYLSYPSIDDSLCYIASMAAYNNLEKTLDITDNIKSYYFKAHTLSNIATITNNHKIYYKALRMAIRIDDYSKEEILNNIASKIAITNLDKAMEIANSIDNDYKDEVLGNIASKIAITNLDKAMEIANSIDNDYKDEVLGNIASKIAIINLDKAMQITNSLNNYDKTEALSNIASKIIDTNVDKALEIANSIDHYSKEIILSNITSKIASTNLDEALKIAYNLQKERAMRNIFNQINNNLSNIEMTNTNLDKAINIANSLNNYKDKALSNIALKIADTNTERAMEIANSLNDYYKDKALSNITSKIAITNLDKALEIANSIDYYKDKALSNIASKIAITNLDKALEIANSINDYKDEVLGNIASSIADKDISKAIDITNSIDDTYFEAITLGNIISKINDPKILDIILKILYKYSEDTFDYDKSEIISNIAAKIVNINIDKTLDIINNIPYIEHILLAISKISSNISNPKILEKFLEIINDIDYDDDNIRDMLSNIYSQLNITTDQILDIINSIEYNEHKLFAMNNIALNTNNHKILNEFLEIINDIDCDEGDSYDTLSTIHTRIVDITIDNALEVVDININQGLKIIDTVSSNEYKNDALYTMLYKLLNININTALVIANSIDNKTVASEIKQKIYSKNNTKEQIFNRAIFNKKYKENETIDYITYLDSDSVLRYYDIETNSHTDSEIVSIFKDLKTSLSTLDDKKEKRKVFNSIKDKIIDDETLLKQFIENYGTKFDIEDIDDFDDEFSLKSFEDYISK